MSCLFLDTTCFCISHVLTHMYLLNCMVFYFNFTPRYNWNDAKDGFKQQLITSVIYWRVVKIVS